MKKHNILKYPLVTEKSVRLLHNENRLLFVVDLNANKRDIKDAFEKQFEMTVDDINTYITNKGEKRAYIKLKSEHPAMDVMTKLGLM